MASEDEEVISDTELYEFKSGLIKPLKVEKNCTNDILGLKSKLDELKSKNCDWVERMDIVVPLVEGTTLSTLDYNNDFKREMHFLQQAQVAAQLGLEKLSEVGVATARPEDYFAEMIKADNHMRKVRQNLLNKQKRIEAAEKVKKLREMRKYGKKVQVEVLQNRVKDKKSTVQAVKDYRQGRGDKPGFLDGDDRRGYRGDSGKSRRRQAKDVRYGDGGRKRGIKRNTAESSADMRGYRGKSGGGGGYAGRNAGGYGDKSEGGGYKGRTGGGGGKRDGSKRLGKGRRIKQQKRKQLRNR